MSLTPFPISLNIRNWREHYPFTSNFCNLSVGHRLHYIDEGDGSPVVMLHGNPTWSFYYRNLVRGLKPRHRCIVPDHLGCGLSDKPQHASYRLEQHIMNLEELLFAHLKLTTFSLILHDWGGAIGMGLAVRHPERIARITVLNTAAFMLPYCPWRIRLCRIPGFGALAVRGFNAFARGAQVMAIKGRRLSPSVRAGYLAPYDSWRNRIALHRFVQDIPLHPRHPTWATIAELEARLPILQDKPMMICWGGRDFCFNDRFLDVWRQKFPQAEVHRFADAGHYILEDAGEQILPLIQDFLIPTH